MRKWIVLITTVLLGFLLVSGIGKYIRAEPIENNLEAVEVPRKWWDSLATLEMLCVLGLIVGLFWTPVGVLAALGTAGYFLGAVLGHVRTGDKNVLPSGFAFTLSAILTRLYARRQ